MGANFDKLSSGELEEKAKNEGVSLWDFNWNQAVRGSVAVRNETYEKLVFSRITFNAWKEYKDVPAIWVKSFSNNSLDMFDFEVPWPNSEATTAEFAICCTQGNRTAWDNNHRQNYKIERTIGTGTLEEAEATSQENGRIGSVGDCLEAPVSLVFDPEEVTKEDEIREIPSNRELLTDEEHPDKSDAGEGPTAIQELNGSVSANPQPSFVSETSKTILVSNEGDGSASKKSRTNERRVSERRKTGNNNESEVENQLPCSSSVLINRGYDDKIPSAAERPVLDGIAGLSVAGPSHTTNEAKATRRKKRFSFRKFLNFFKFSRKSK